MTTFERERYAEIETSLFKGHAHYFGLFAYPVVDETLLNIANRHLMRWTTSRRVLIDSDEEDSGGCELSNRCPFVRGQRLLITDYSFLFAFCNYKV